MASKGDKRKLAAILSADVVGYSRLMGADESGTLAQLKAHRKELIDPTIGDHDGRIVNTAGDSVLAEFASVVDAVQCAVAIQRVMPDRTAGVAGDRRIALRIGINLGDVIVEGDDIYGDGVNVAARLEGMAEPGGICISRSARDQVRDKLPINLEDLGEHEVKNISRPVRVFRVRIAEETPGVDAVGAQDVPDKPSIAVLSFVNMSGDTEQDYFADGIAEDIITGLSKVGSLFVIARNSSFAYKGANVNVTHVGREFGVRYVLEGSVRKAGERVRITAQLVKAESGHHLWAERYDRQLEDIFAVQDEVTERIIASLEVTLSAGERRRLTRNHPNPEAYDHLLRAKRQAELESREGMLESRRLSLKATEIDPDYAAAYACIGQSYLNEQAWSDDPATCVEKALEYVRKGLAVDPNDAMAHAILSGAYLWQKQFDEALAEARKAVALDPNDADMAAHMGQVLVWVGESEQAIPLIERAMRANPTYPHWYLFVLGLAQLLVGRPNEAIASLQTGLGSLPGLGTALPCARGQHGTGGETRGGAGDLAPEPWRGLRDVAGLGVRGASVSAPRGRREPDRGPARDRLAGVAMTKASAVRRDDGERLAGLAWINERPLMAISGRPASARLTSANDPYRTLTRRRPTS